VKEATRRKKINRGICSPTFSYNVNQAQIVKKQVCVMIHWISNVILITTTQINYIYKDARKKFLKGHCQCTHKMFS